MREGCENSGILQGGTIELSGFQHALYGRSRNGKNGPKGDSEIQRAVTAIMDLGTGPSPCFRRARLSPHFHVARGKAVTQTSEDSAATQSCPRGPGEQRMQPKGATLEPSDLMGEKTDLMEIILPGLGLVWDRSPLLSCPFLPFGMGMSVLHLSHHDCCLVSQIHSWKGILPQDESQF